MITIGNIVPDIVLESYHNDQFVKVNLRELKGKWFALVFYPADFTFVCPTELEELAVWYPEFQKEGAEILSISTDTQFAHKAWHDSSEAIKKICYPMLADPTGNLCRMFGTYIESEGVSLRGSFLFNPDGILKTLEIHDNSIGRSAEELFRKLQAAKYVYEHGGEVCPAKWRPGEKTLRPGLNLVGKI